ncbi:hypothetical protein [Streptomyces griseosporeus]|uniref:hypothetical protein n=1 Tax=Streptomyces griseosporeus TaxID=1910 RepID=UPI0036FD4D6D
MADTDQAYVDTLASQLCAAHQAIVDNLEDDLAEHRGRMAIIARFINNEAIALDIRQGLAQDLRLPAPAR